MGPDVGTAQPRAVPAESVASARPPGVAREEASAATEPQRVVPAVAWDVEAEPRRAAEVA
jgi:hypothetical protein